MKYHLTIRFENDVNERRWFDQERIGLGAHPDNDVVLPHDEVSRRHAWIERRGSTFKLLDQDSTNGTELNGSPIVADHALPLAHGDSIQIGPYALIFECPDAEAPFDTVRVVDPERAAARVRAGLLRRHAELIETSPSRREVLLQAHLEEALSAHRDAVKLEILSRLGKSLTVISGTATKDAAEERRSDSGDRRKALNTNSDAKSNGVSSARTHDAADPNSEPGVGPLAPRTTQRREASYVASQAAMERLARNLLDRELTSERQIERFSRCMEIVAETLFEWLPELLATRKRQQEQFGVDHLDLLEDEISPEDQPLQKLSLDPSTMRRQLLEPSRDKDLAAMRTSLRTAFRDIADHQAAFLAAMEASTKALLRRISPKAINASVGEAHSRAALWAGEKSPQWRAFDLMFTRLQAEGLTDQVLLEAFQRGYLGARPLSSRADEGSDQDAPPAASDA